MLRGTASGLEFVFSGASFDDGWADVAARLAERPEFYRGSSATAILDSAPADDGFRTFLEAVRGYGIDVRGLYGDDTVEALAGRCGVAFLGAPPRPTVASFAQKRAARDVRLTERAKSLEADFAGARADIAKRRARGEPSVPRPAFGPAAPADSAGTAIVEQAVASGGPSTLYHRGTLRGGQTLQQLGNVVVVGDVNPGAELIASGDIVVFGALRGTAHAGAQGDASARVFALDLAPTQLRIATYIAADDGKRRTVRPEVAYVEGDRIAIVAHGGGGAR